MLRKLFIILMLSSIIGAEEYTVADVQDAYSRIFTIKVDNNKEHRGYSHEIRKLDKNHFLAGLVNDNIDYINFLLENLYDYHLDSLHLYLEDTSGVGEHFKNAICRDTLFDKMLLTVADNYLRSRGDKIADFKGFKKSKLDMDEVLAVAVRFFYLIKDEEQEKIYWSICIGNHGQHELKDNRNFAVEAFCYAAIWRNGSKWFDRLKKVTKMAQRICNSEDYDTRFSRIQGAVWMYMAQNPQLREALEKEYERTRDFLPFKIKGL